MGKTTALAFIAGQTSVRPVHILLSAMDAGAAGQMKELAHVMHRSDTLTGNLYVAGPAAEALAQSDVPHRCFTVLPKDHQKMIDAAARIMRAEAPDILITSLSNDGCGPDEAFAAAARQIPSPPQTAVLLDDRGPLFTLDGRWPEHLLATSQATMAWAQENMPQCTTHLVGSPKHEAISRLPAAAMRARYRADNGISDTTLIVTFIAQTDAISGHNETFQDLAHALLRRRGNAQDRQFHLIIRPHPGMPRGGLWCYEEARRMSLPVTCDRGRNILETLAATDILFGCTSTSLVDYVWLSLADTRMRAVPIHLLIRPEIREFFNNQQGTYIPDLTRRGLAMLPTDLAELDTLIGRAFEGTLTAPNPDRESVRDLADPEQALCDLLHRLAAGRHLASPPVDPLVIRT